MVVITIGMICGGDCDGDDDVDADDRAYISWMGERERE